jgi:hypothetical protein
MRLYSVVMGYTEGVVFRIIIVKLAHNGVVAGSNPARPTTLKFHKNRMIKPFKLIQ